MSTEPNATDPEAARAADPGAGDTAAAAAPPGGAEAPTAPEAASASSSAAKAISEAAQARAQVPAAQGGSPEPPGALTSAAAQQAAAPSALSLGFAASATRPAPLSGDCPDLSNGFAATATAQVPEALTPDLAAAQQAAEGGALSSGSIQDELALISARARTTSQMPMPGHLRHDEVIHSPLGRLVRAVEKYAVGLVLLAMGLLPTAEAISRLAFNEGIPGALTYTRHLTLWIGFLGALLATGQGKHLALAIGEFIHGPLKKAADIYVGLLSTAVCALLAYAALVMVQLEPDDRLLPGGIPEWWSEAIMPAALFLMAARFAWKSSPKRIERLPAALLLIAILSLCLLQLHAAGTVDLPFVPPEARAFAILDFLEANGHRLVLPGAILILLGVLLGAPLFVGMSGLAMLLFFGEGTPIASVPSETYRLVQNAALPAIPILTAAGYVLAEGGASKRLLRVAKALIGWAPGGLALMIVVILAGFTAFTGGSGVTILALGGLVLPMLLKENYPKGMSLGLVTSSGSLGLLFPPSLPVILYSVVAGVGMEDLFIAGLLPGLLLVLLVAAVGVGMGIRCQAPRQRFSLREAGAALWEAKWELFIPFVVLAAIFTGFATLVEAAAIALLAALIAECAIFGDLDWRRDLPETLARAGTLVGAVIILLGVAMGLTSYLVDAEIPALALEWTQAHIHSPWVFLLALNGVLLVLGSVLEIYSAIVILAPLLVPMAAAYGIDPVHLGIVFLANLELGFLFPPVGLNLILSSTRFGEPLTRLYKVALPFLIIMAVGVLLTTYIPSMTTGFLALVKGG